MTRTEIVIAAGSVAEYYTWLEEAKHGDVLVYWTGDLQYDRQVPEGASFEVNGEASESDIKLIVLDALAARIQSDSVAGLVRLTQKRLGVSNYEYRATRVRPFVTSVVQSALEEVQ